MGIEFSEPPLPPSLPPLLQPGVSQGEKRGEVPVCWLLGSVGSWTPVFRDLMHTPIQRLEGEYKSVCSTPRSLDVMKSLGSYCLVRPIEHDSWGSSNSRPSHFETPSWSPCVPTTPCLGKEPTQCHISYSVTCQPGTAPWRLTL